MERAKRQKLASPRAPTRRRVATRCCETWLDKLPEDVCVRLAAHVCHDDQDLDGLALAKTSPLLRRAVLTILDHSLIIWDKESFGKLAAAPKTGNWDTLTNRKWMSVMGADVHKVFQPMLRTLLYKRPPRYTLRLLSLPNLRMVDITDHPNYLSAVSRSSSIRELSIRWLGQVPLTKMLETFSKVQLTKLKTICPDPRDRSPTFQCPFSDPRLSNTDGNGISTCLPGLKSVDIRCVCYSAIPQDGEIMFWQFLASLKTVEEVSFVWVDSGDNIPQESYRFLSKRASVRIMESPFANEFASRIGSSVTAILNDHDILNAALTTTQVCGLPNLARLKKLSFKIREGAEKDLPDVVAKLPELNVLNLSWERNVEGSRDRCRYTGSRFATALPGAMLRTVQVAPQLFEIGFVQVRIPLIEVVAILSSIRGQLRFFEFSMGDQEEPPLDRLEMVLLAAVQNNPELRYFVVDDMSYGCTLAPRKDWNWQIERVLSGLRFLQKRSPHVYIGDLIAEARELLSP